MFVDRRERPTFGKAKLADRPLLHQYRLGVGGATSRCCGKKRLSMCVEENARPVESSYELLVGEAANKNALGLRQGASSVRHSSSLCGQVVL